ncbi:hypothetical protein I4U23_016733 [Adineta vaga]|nr:hypothetical protein I4U23_016733 [Adineta vaga]
MNPMIIVQKETVLSAWGWYEHHLNVIKKLFTIDHNFQNKSTDIPPSISPKQQTLKQLIMYLDFNIFTLSSISVKHPITEKTGIIKNRPALGERALQELMNDNLLKFNYFLTDIRGRNVKSYIKVPVPYEDDPTRDVFIANLLKHGIDFDEYCSIYKTSSLPPYNNFSSLTLEIFEHSACFVNEYSKYRDQLNHVIQKHIENCVIREVVEGNFVIQNANEFTRQYEDIENLVLSNQSNQANSKRQSFNIINQTNKSTTQCRHTTVSIVNVSRDVVEKSQQAQHHSPKRTSCDQQNAIIIENFTTDADGLLDDPDNSLMSLSEKSGDGKDESSNISTQKTMTDITNKGEHVSEQAIKKVMQSIMTGKSVIYTKTDLSMICNKPNIRLTAVDRLIDAKLLKYESNLWIEPTRAKKPKKDLKPIFRPGWLKMCPSSNSNASIFDFIQTLQKHVNLSYDDFLKSFYPHLKENVFTHNNWRLSDEVIKIFQSNIFYKEHVRYDIARFGPNDIINNELDVANQLATSTAPASHLNNLQEATTNENIIEISQQRMSHDSGEEEDITFTCPLSTSVKRKLGSHTNFPENPRRVQPISLLPTIFYYIDNLMIDFILLEHIYSY